MALENSQPRYEFRIWGNHLSPVRDHIAATATPPAPRESAETYILSAATDTANVKIRAGLLDIKLLVEQQGRLERWRPALKAPFSIDARTIVEDVFPDLKMAPPHIERPSYTHGEFIRDLVKPRHDLATVDVMKRRWKFQFEQCTAEFAEVEIAGGVCSETVEFESEDPAAVLRAIAKFGLTAYPNISYVRHLKLMIGMIPRTTIDAAH
jgi:hypothetical protein